MTYTPSDLAHRKAATKRCADGRPVHSSKISPPWSSTRCTLRINRRVFFLWSPRSPTGNEKRLDGFRSNHHGMFPSRRQADSLSLFIFLALNQYLRPNPALNSVNEVQVKPSDGWPRHMYWAQKSLSEALLKTDTDGCLDRIQR